MSASAAGDRRATGTRQPTILSRDERLDVERSRRAGRLTLEERSTQAVDLVLVLLEQAQSRPARRRWRCCSGPSRGARR